MSKEHSEMEKFNFLLGIWKLKSEVPKSQFSDFLSGIGKGEFKKILDGKYVTFDYDIEYPNLHSRAHAVFRWNKNNKNYNYWWCENSGEYSQASCNFIDDKTLYLNWHNSLFVQIFQLQEDGSVLLEMRYPKNKDEYEIVLRVDLSREKF